MPPPHLAAQHRHADAVRLLLDEGGRDVDPASSLLRATNATQTAAAASDGGHAPLGWEIRSEFREFRRNSEFRSLFLAELPVLVSDSDRKVGSRHFFNITEPIPAINVPFFFRGILFPRFFVEEKRCV